MLLEKAGLLVLEKNRGTEATVADIVENPKKLNILELEAAQLPRSVDDLEIAVIPMNYVISAGLSPEKDGFFFEDMQRPTPSSSSHRAPTTRKARGEDLRRIVPFAAGGRIRQGDLPRGCETLLVKGPQAVFCSKQKAPERASEAFSLCARHGHVLKGESPKRRW